MGKEMNLIKLAEQKGDYKTANVMLNGLNKHLTAKIKRNKKKLKELKNAQGK